MNPQGAISEPARAGLVRRAIVVGTWLATLTWAMLLVVFSQTGFGGPASVGFTLVFVALAFDVMVFASVGAILAIRRPRNIVGAVLMAAGFLIGQSFVGYVAGAILTRLRGADDPLAGLTSLLGALGVVPALVVAGPLLALLFPDGRLPGPRWRWPVAAIAVALALSSVLVLLRPGAVGEELAANPFGVTGVAWLEALLPIGQVLGAITLPASLLLALAAVVVRFRRSRGAERKQLTWFVAANLVVIVFVFLFVADGAGDPTAFDILGICSLSLPPIAVGVAILRYRLYEIDRLISRSISYAVITSILFGVFVVVNLTLQAWLSPQLGSGGSIAVAASTLFVAALFNPVRVRVQRLVDRRFDRARFDAEQTVATLSATLRDEVDLDVLGGAITDVVARSLAPATTALWLRRGPAR